MLSATIYTYISFTFLLALYRFALLLTALYPTLACIFVILHFLPGMLRILISRRYYISPFRTPALKRGKHAVQKYRHNNSH